VSLAKAEDAAKIVDPSVRAAVIAKAAALGGFGNKFEGHWPVLKTRRGGEIPIKRVRIRKAQSVVPIGKGPRQRHVIPGSNHHAAIIAEFDAKGAIKRYVFETVTMLEALERKRQRVPIVNRVNEPGKRQFLCTLSEGDMVEGRRPADGIEKVWRVRTVDKNGRIFLTAAVDARKKDEILKENDYWSPTVNSLFSAGARKIQITHLGEVISAND